MNFQEEGSGMHNYSVGSDHYISGDETVIVKEELPELYKWLNDDREESAEYAGIAKELLCDWTFDADDGAVLVRK